MLYVLNEDNSSGYRVYSERTSMRTKIKIGIEGTAKWSIPDDSSKLAILDIQYPKKGMTTFK